MKKFLNVILLLVVILLAGCQMGAPPPPDSTDWQVDKEGNVVPKPHKVVIPTIVDSTKTQEPKTFAAPTSGSGSLGNFGLANSETDNFKIDFNYMSGSLDAEKALFSSVYEGSIRNLKLTRHGKEVDIYFKLRCNPEFTDHGDIVNTIITAAHYANSVTELPALVWFNGKDDVCGKCTAAITITQINVKK